MRSGGVGGHLGAGMAEQLLHDVLGNAGVDEPGSVWRSMWTVNSTPVQALIRATSLSTVGYDIGIPRRPPHRLTNT